MEAQPFTLRDAQGKPQMEGSLADGKLEGMLRIYEHGEAKAAMHYSGGLQQGPCVILHAPHRPSARLNYEAGLLHGVAEFFSPEGQLQRRSHYLAGARHGLEEDYYPSGFVREQRSYEAGRLAAAPQQFKDGVLAGPKKK